MGYEIMYKPLYDPFGKVILIPSVLARKSGQKLNDIRHVITSPAFIINVRDEKFYFFRLTSHDTNMLVEVHCKKEQLVVQKLLENPSVEYILILLKKGALISFQ